MGIIINKMQTKKQTQINTEELLKMFNKMYEDGGIYWEKDNTTANNPLIHKLIYFKFTGNSTTYEYALTKQEYDLWRGVKPKIK